MKTLDNAVRAACALMLAGNVLLGAPARADTVLLGSDYLETVQPTFFIPLGPLNPLAGLPIGPGTTDTIVRRRGDCSLSLFGAGSNCTIPIELVALSLVSVVNPMVRLRESPTLQSTGMMTMTSNGSGTGGTFASFFDVFVELSLDGGLNFAPVPQLQLQSSGTQWTTMEQGLLVPGLMGDQNANLHTDKGLCAPMACVDFYIVGTVTEQEIGVGTHSARGAVPEPGSLALLGLALALSGWTCRHRRLGAPATRPCVAHVPLAGR